MKDRWKLRALELIVGLAFTGKDKPAVIPYIPAKTEVSRHEHRDLERTTPERMGVSSSRIHSFLTALEEERRVNIHNILIVKDGAVICECSAPGYGTNIRHLSHSMSKTLTGIAICMLIDEGRLDKDAKLSEIFREYKITDKRAVDMSVYHLLTMTSGVPFSEAGSVTEDEWARAFFSSRLSFAPGEMFAYNSMNSYILAKIVVRITGMSLADYLTVKLFKPLGIHNVLFEKGPEGIEKGGWGVHLSAESWAKIGMMMRDGGVYRGHRILSERMVAEATSTHAKTPEKVGSFNYGYQTWVSREDDDFLFSGMLGQNVWVSPKNGIVAVTNSGNNEIFQSNPTVELIRKYFGGDISDDSGFERVSLTVLRNKEAGFYRTRRWITPRTPKRGIAYKLGLRRAKPLPKEWDALLGTYVFAKNNQGVLPLFIRAMQNNYLGGIRSFTFSKEGEHLFLNSREGERDHKFEIGIYEFKSTAVDFGGEKYIVSALGTTVEDAHHGMHYNIELVLPEMPNSRKIRIVLPPDGRMIVKMQEMPNKKLAEPLVEGIYAMNPKLAFIVGLLERRLGDRFVNRKLGELFSPTLVAANTSSPHYLEIITNENTKMSQQVKETAAIAVLLQKFAEADE